MEEVIQQPEIKEVKMFYGEMEIKSIVDGIDPGTKRVHVVNENAIPPVEMKFDLPEWEINACATSWPTDATEVRNLRAVYTVDKIYDVLKELNIRVTPEEFNFLTQKLTRKMEGIRKQAMLDCFGVSEDIDVRVQLLESKIKKKIWQDLQSS